MTEEAVRQLIKNLDDAKRRKQNRDRDTGKAAKLESNFGDGTLGAKEVQRPACQRFLVRVVSVRKRLLDTDNLCEKFHLDLCRYAGAIPDDSPGKIILETSQRKAAKNENEHVRITIDKL